MWRAEDQALLGRLEDELVLSRLFHHHVGTLAARSVPHPRAAGLVAAARALPGGEQAVLAALAGDVSKLARLVEAPPMRARPPEMLHHIALMACSRLAIGGARASCPSLRLQRRHAG